MDSRSVDDISISDLDQSTTYTGINTPSESTTTDHTPHDFAILFDQVPKTPKTTTLVPYPGSPFIIKRRENGHVITLLGGRIVLAPPDNRHESTHWECVENSGWLGFRHPISNNYLGYDKTGQLCCTAERHREWEYFCVRPSVGGGYFLLMQHRNQLCPVGIKVKHGVQKLERLETAVSSGSLWEFLQCDDVSTLKASEGE